MASGVGRPQSGDYFGLSASRARVTVIIRSFSGFLQAQICALSMAAQALEEAK